MFPLPRGAVSWFFVLICISTIILQAQSSAEPRIVCYYTNWSVYRPGTAKFNPQNINPYLCTHLIYAFGGFTKDNTLKPFDKYQDIEKGGYAKFTGLKTYNRNLKTMLAIGGWNEGSSRFSPLVASPERRQQFVKNAIKFLRQNHFDGLDLDWEYPAFRDGGKARDRDNYAQFVQELRQEFDRESSKTGRPRLLLTMAVPAGIEYIEKGYDIPKLNRYLDWFNLLTYDYHSAFEPAVNHHAPLLSLEEDDEYNFDTELNIDYSVKFYLNAGADRDKLVLGIPTYGRSYTLFNPDANDIGAPADGPGEQGDATREKGYLAYYEICQNIKDDDEWEVVQPNPNAMGPYAFKDNQWVGYDDEAIARKKSIYVAQNGLGGIMFWSIDNDDFRGSCTGKPYPIIEAAKEALLDNLGISVNDIIPQPPPSSRPRKPTRNRNTISSSKTSNSVKSDYEIKQRPSVSTRKPASRRRPTTTTTTQRPVTRKSEYNVQARTTTPEPPTTPDPGSDFKCVDEGFFPHPRDCKKYFWCLDSGPSNLGIVAHQFTCPSGLFFNKQADSCDYARNVICAKPKSTTPSPVTTTTTTKAPSTTTISSRPKITVATSKNTFFRTTTTSTTTPAYEEYEYDEDDEEEGPTKDIEDPKVIKELIDLIKKVGGLEELERQLKLQEDGVKDSRIQVSTDSPAALSKTLEKVLSQAGAAQPKNRYSQFFNRKQDKHIDEVTASAEPATVIQQSDNRYSSVIRNSRPNAQNAGLEQLPEFDAFLKEKPKYVTIQRTRPTTASTAALSSNEEIESDDDQSNENDESVENDAPQYSPAVSRYTTPQYNYVNIRRQRPTTTESSRIQDIVDEKDEDNYVNIRSRRPAITESINFEEKTENYVNIRRQRPTTEAINLEDKNENYVNIRRQRPTTVIPILEDESEEEEEEAEIPKRIISYNEQTNTPGPQYINFNRRRPTTTTTTTASPIKSTTENEPNYVSVTANNRYKHLERTRPTTIVTTIKSSDLEIDLPQSQFIHAESLADDHQTDEHRSTTPIVELGINSVPTTNSDYIYTTSLFPDTTRTYANVDRKVTTTTTQNTITTTTDIPQMLTSIYETDQINPEYFIMNIMNLTQDSILTTTTLPVLSELLTDKYETETFNYDTINENNEVTTSITDSDENISNLINPTTNSYPKLNFNQTNKIEHSVNETNVRHNEDDEHLNSVHNISNNINLSSIDDIIIKTTTQSSSSSPPPSSVSSTSELILNNLSINTSSPRPFGFPGRRTRPTRFTTTTSTTSSPLPELSTSSPSKLPEKVSSSVVYGNLSKRKFFNVNKSVSSLLGERYNNESSDEELVSNLSDSTESRDDSIVGETETSTVIVPNPTTRSYRKSINFNRLNSQSITSERNRNKQIPILSSSASTSSSSNLLIDDSTDDDTDTNNINTNNFTSTTRRPYNRTQLRSRGDIRYRVSKFTKENDLNDVASSAQRPQPARHFRPVISLKEEIENESTDINSGFNRPLRPTRLNEDLSSLTAFDFNRRGNEGNSRPPIRRRPNFVNRNVVRNKIKNETTSVDEQTVELVNEINSISTTSESSTTNRFNVIGTRPKVRQFASRFSQATAATTSTETPSDNEFNIQDITTQQPRGFIAPIKRPQTNRFSVNSFRRGRVSTTESLISSEEPADIQTTTEEFILPIYYREKNTIKPVIVNSLLNDPVATSLDGILNKFQYETTTNDVEEPKEFGFSYSATTQNIDQLSESISDSEITSTSSNTFKRNGSFSEISNENEQTTEDEPLIITDSPIIKLKVSDQLSDDDSASSTQPPVILTLARKLSFSFGADDDVNVEPTQLSDSNSEEITIDDVKNILEDEADRTTTTEVQSIRGRNRINVQNDSDIIRIVPAGKQVIRRRPISSTVASDDESDEIIDSNIITTDSAGDMLIEGENDELQSVSTTENLDKTTSKGENSENIDETTTTSSIPRNSPSGFVRRRLLVGQSTTSTESNNNSSESIDKISTTPNSRRIVRPSFRFRSSTTTEPNDNVEQGETDENLEQIRPVIRRPRPFSTQSIQNNENENQSRRRVTTRIRQRPFGSSTTENIEDVESTDSISLNENGLTERPALRTRVISRRPFGVQSTTSTTESVSLNVDDENSNVSQRTRLPSRVISRQRVSGFTRQRVVPSTSKVLDSDSSETVQPTEQTINDGIISERPRFQTRIASRRPFGQRNQVSTTVAEINEDEDSSIEKSQNLSRESNENDQPTERPRFQPRIVTRRPFGIQRPSSSISPIIVNDENDDDENTEERPRITPVNRIRRPLNQGFRKPPIADQSNGSDNLNEEQVISPVIQRPRFGGGGLNTIRRFNQRTTTTTTNAPISEEDDSEYDDDEEEDDEIASTERSRFTPNSRIRKPFGQQTSSTTTASVDGNLNSVTGQSRFAPGNRGRRPFNLRNPSSTIPSTTEDTEGNISQRTRFDFNKRPRLNLNQRFTSTTESDLSKEIKDDNDQDELEDDEIINTTELNLGDIENKLNTTRRVRIKVINRNKSNVTSEISTERVLLENDETLSLIHDEEHHDDSTEAVTEDVQNSLNPENRRRKIIRKLIKVVKNSTDDLPSGSDDDGATTTENIKNTSETIITEPISTTLRNTRFRKVIRINRPNKNLTVTENGDEINLSSTTELNKVTGDDENINRGITQGRKYIVRKLRPFSTTTSTTAQPSTTPSTTTTTTKIEVSASDEEYDEDDTDEEYDDDDESSTESNIFKVIPKDSGKFHIQKVINRTDSSQEIIKSSNEEIKTQKGNYEENDEERDGDSDEDYSQEYSNENRTGKAQNITRINLNVLSNVDRKIEKTTVNSKNVVGIRPIGFRPSKPQVTKTSAEIEENENEDDSEEDIEESTTILTDSLSTVTRPKLISLNRPTFRPRRPTEISSPTTESSSTTSKNYVRKYTSNFTIGQKQDEFGVENENPVGIIRSGFRPARPISQSGLDDSKEDRDEEEYDDEDDEHEDNEDDEDKEDQLHKSKKDDDEEEEGVTEQTRPVVKPIQRPVIGLINRISTTRAPITTSTVSTTKTTPYSQDENSEAENDEEEYDDDGDEEESEEKEQIKSRRPIISLIQNRPRFQPASAQGRFKPSQPPKLPPNKFAQSNEEYDNNAEEHVDEEDEDENQNVSEDIDENNRPTLTRNPINRPPLISQQQRPAFQRPSPPTFRNRPGQLPSTTTIHPASTRSYPRKFGTPSTTESIKKQQPNLLEEIDVNALNQRNRKIFNKNKNITKTNLSIGNSSISSSNLSNTTNISSNINNTQLVEEKVTQKSIESLTTYPDTTDTIIENLTTINDNTITTTMEILLEDTISLNNYTSTNTTTTQILVDQLTEINNNNKNNNNSNISSINNTTTPYSTNEDQDLYNSTIPQESTTSSSSSQSSTPNSIYSDFLTTKRLKITTTLKPTTLHHIFAIDYDSIEEGSREKQGESAEEISKIHEKLVEINRIVEIYSKQETRKQGNGTDTGNDDLTNLVLEKVPTLDKIGEINRVILVKLQNHNNLSRTDHSAFIASLDSLNKTLSYNIKSKQNKDFSIDSKSSIADYSPTEYPPTSPFVPVRNDIPKEFTTSSTTPTTITNLEATIVDEKNDVNVKLNNLGVFSVIPLEKKSKNIVYPEGIFGIETSTISLEGLFNSGARESKQQNNDPNLSVVYATTPVYYHHDVIPNNINVDSERKISTTEEIPVIISTTTEATTTTTTTGTTPPSPVYKPDPHYVRALAPALRPESNETYPLVISIANLDQVILSKVEKLKINHQNDNVDETTQQQQHTTTTEILENSTNLDGITTENIVNEEEVEEKIVNIKPSIIGQLIEPESSSEITRRAKEINKNDFKTLPKHLSVKILTENLPNNNNNNNHNNEERKPLKIRPQYRPVLRRPGFTLNRERSPTVSPSSLSTTTPSNGITETTESINAISSYVRRTRPTTTTITPRSTTISNNQIKPSPKIIIRRKFGPRPLNGGDRRQVFTTTTKTTKSPDVDNAGEPAKTQNPLFRRKFTFTTRRPITTTLATTQPPPPVSTPLFIDDDQEAGQSIVQDNKFANHRYNQIGETFDDDIGEALQAISKAPLPFTPILSTTAKYKLIKDTGEDGYYITSTKRNLDITTPKRNLIARRPIKTTVAPIVTPPPKKQTVILRRKPQPFEKVKPIKVEKNLPGRTYRPTIDYDYYDDGDTRIVPKTTSQVKVILHGRGIIECLDQGNFPHPLSCKKFISCAKMETGGVVGWEYTCPKGLSYDPVGGICNWAAGLGCKE